LPNEKMLKTKISNPKLKEINENKGPFTLELEIS
jgi:hypothetical protein